MENNIYTPANVMAKLAGIACTQSDSSVDTEGHSAQNVIRIPFLEYEIKVTMRTDDSLCALGESDFTDTDITVFRKIGETTWYDITSLVMKRLGTKIILHTGTDLYNVMNILAVCRDIGTDL